jgi:hypothetical protein
VAEVLVLLSRSSECLAVVLPESSTSSTDFPRERDRARCSAEYIVRLEGGTSVGEGRWPMRRIRRPIA